MSNILLSPTAVTRKALMILHQKLNFIGAINRQYDDSFSKSGAKIGDSLKIRLPNEYVVRSGATLAALSVAETSTTLQVATQKGVDLNFTSADLTLRMDDFASRILEPAMAVLAANIEADALTMRMDVYNTVDNDAAAIKFNTIMRARRALNDSLAPPDNNRSVILSSAHEVTLVDELKGLFNAQDNISKQYKEGMMGRTAGFDFMSSTLMTDHTTGTAAKVTGYVINGASQQGAALNVKTGTTTFNRGDVITIGNVFSVHPETKVSTGVLQQFVVTAASGASATRLQVSPAIITSGARQNVSVGPADNAAITKVGAGAGEKLSGSLAFHRDAFTFATADLVMPSGVDFSAREVYDGISMRVVRQYDINTDRFPTRIDVLYGFKTIRPQLACRIHADG